MIFPYKLCDGFDKVGELHYNRIIKRLKFGRALAISIRRCYNIIVKKYGKSIYLRALVERLALVTIVAVAAAVAVVLCGCAQKDIAFSSSEIVLTVGETRDLSPYVVFTPLTVKDRSFTLSCDSDCVKIRGTEITAVSGGTADVIAATGDKTATLRVVCEYRNATWLKIAADAPLVQSAGEIEQITFTAQTGENVDPSLSVEWAVNGRSAGSGKTFGFMPDGYGEYEISAKTGDIADRVSVKIYKRSEAFGITSGELEQTRDFSPVRFTACETIDPCNPLSTYEWSVNGAPSSSARVFEFTPKAEGDHEIKLKVNGVEREIDGKPSVTVTARGLRAPSCSVDFDDVDGVYVMWRDGGIVKSVSVTSPDGSRKVYSAGELSQAGLFGRGTFDASEIIEVCADSPSTYKLRLTGDVAGAETEFSQYPREAEQFIKSKIYIKNAFMSSVDDCGDFITELYVVGSHACDAYVAREMNVADAVAAMKTRAAEMGITAHISTQGAVISVELGEYKNIPETADEVNVTQTYTVTPHLEYDQANRRSSSFVMPSDRRSKLAVTNTEQLWYAVTRGYTPVINDSTARAVYSRARTVLLSIIGKDYTDAQKVHAIYDWAQWAAPRSFTSDPASSARFTDAYFADVKDVSARHVGATDEGVAKTVALLCGMEGIECDVVFGDDCKVVAVIGGERYYVDAFGGKRANSETNEAGTHSGLLVPIDEYTPQVTYCLEKHIYNGVYFDFYADGSESDDAEKIESAIFYAFGGQNYNSVTIRDAYGTVIISSSEYGAEFALGDLSDDQIATLKSNIVSAVKAFGKSIDAEYSDADVKIREYDGGVLAVGVVKRTVKQEP